MVAMSDVKKRSIVKREKRERYQPSKKRSSSGMMIIEGANRGCASPITLESHERITTSEMDVEEEEEANHVKRDKQRGNNNKINNNNNNGFNNDATTKKRNQTNNSRFRTVKAGKRKLFIDLLDRASTTSKGDWGNYQFDRKHINDAAANELLLESSEADIIANERIQCGVDSKAGTAFKTLLSFADKKENKNNNTTTIPLVILFESKDAENGIIAQRLAIGNIMLFNGFFVRYAKDYPLKSAELPYFRKRVFTTKDVRCFPAKDYELFEWDCLYGPLGAQNLGYFNNIFEPSTTTTIATRATLNNDDDDGDDDNDDNDDNDHVSNNKNNSQNGEKFTETKRITTTTTSISAKHEDDDLNQSNNNGDKYLEHVRNTYDSVFPDEADIVEPEGLMQRAALTLVRATVWLIKAEELPKDIYDFFGKSFIEKLIAFSEKYAKTVDTRPQLDIAAVRATTHILRVKIFDAHQKCERQAKRRKEKKERREREKEDEGAEEEEEGKKKKAKRPRNAGRVQQRKSREEKRARRCSDASSDRNHAQQYARDENYDSSNDSADDLSESSSVLHSDLDGSAGSRQRKRGRLSKDNVLAYVDDAVNRIRSSKNDSQNPRKRQKKKKKENDFNDEDNENLLKQLPTKRDKKKQPQKQKEQRSASRPKKSSTKTATTTTTTTKKKKKYKDDYKNKSDDGATTKRSKRTRDTKDTKESRFAKKLSKKLLKILSKEKEYDHDREAKRSQQDEETTDEESCLSNNEQHQHRGYNRLRKNQIGKKSVERTERREKWCSNDADGVKEIIKKAGKSLPTTGSAARVKLQKLHYGKKDSFDRSNKNGVQRNSQRNTQKSRASKRKTINRSPSNNNHQYAVLVEEDKIDAQRQQHSSRSNNRNTPKRKKAVREESLKISRVSDALPLRRNEEIEESLNGSSVYTSCTDDSEEDKDTLREAFNRNYREAYDDNYESERCFSSKRGDDYKMSRSRGRSKQEREERESSSPISDATTPDEESDSRIENELTDDKCCLLSNEAVDSEPESNIRSGVDDEYQSEAEETDIES